jgi:acetylglutamate kinase
MNKYDKKYNLILDFLKIIEANRESKRYLRLFHRGDPARFAVVKLGGTLIENSKEIIAIDLAYLSHLDLFPIVIHGGGTQIDQALMKAGISSKKKDGIRLTTEEQLPVIKKALDRVNTQLVKAITKYEGKAIGLTRNVFVAQQHSDCRLGLVGTIKKVNTELISEVIRCKRIPVISCLGTDEHGHLYNINADEAAKAVVLAIKPKKYIILTDEGGIKDAEGKIISNICLLEELPQLEKNHIIKDGMLVKVKEAKETLEKINYHLPIQITSSKHLLKELFTEKGNGTFIKLGAEILEQTGWSKVDKKKAERLISKSFRRALKSDYFTKHTSYIFLDCHYRGIGIIKKVEDMYYLDKFCVAESAQGQGIAGDIWLKITTKCPNLFWRSRIDNPINNWYFEKAQGSWKCIKWVLFWINLREDQISTAKNYILTLEESFHPSIK